MKRTAGGIIATGFLEFDAGINQFYDVTALEQFINKGLGDLGRHGP